MNGSLILANSIIENYYFQPTPEWNRWKWSSQLNNDNDNNDDDTNGVVLVI